MNAIVTVEPMMISRRCQEVFVGETLDLKDRIDDQIGEQRP